MRVCHHCKGPNKTPDDDFGESGYGTQETYRLVCNDGKSPRLSGPKLNGVNRTDHRFLSVLRSRKRNQRPSGYVPCVNYSRSGSEFWDGKRIDRVTSEHSFRPLLRRQSETYCTSWLTTNSLSSMGRRESTRGVGFGTSAAADAALAAIEKPYRPCRSESSEFCITRAASTARAWM